ncbi:MAG: homoserine kinase, partial [Clostridia bacterium]|nr:homoserine kinase [Clostridia bacterium]
MRVPATSANLGPGFDCLGMALSLYNWVEIEETPDVDRVEVVGEGAASLVANADNLVVAAASRLFAEVGYRPRGLTVRLFNRIPLSRGLGSSAAAIVGGLVAANRLAGDPLTPDELLQLAVFMEGHPDNVTPAMLGGFTVACMANGRSLTVRLDPPDLQLAVLVPDHPVGTHEARRVLPHHVEWRDAVANVQRASLLVAALTSGRWDLLPTALEDRLHQPYRLRLVPGLAEALAAARRRSGLLGGCLSGSGSSLLLFLAPGTPSLTAASVEAVADELRLRGIGCRVLYLAPSRAGATIVDSARQE